MYASIRRARQQSSCFGSLVRRPISRRERTPNAPRKISIIVRHTPYSFRRRRFSRVLLRFIRKHNKILFTGIKVLRACPSAELLPRYPKRGAKTFFVHHLPAACHKILRVTSARIPTEPKEQTVYRWFPIFLDYFSWMEFGRLLRKPRRSLYFKRLSVEKKKTPT